MPAFTYRMPAGIPGMLNRTEIATVEAQVTMATNPPLSYGVPVALDGTTGQIRPMGTGDAAGAIYGFLVRPYPTSGNLINEPIGTSTPASTGICNVMRRGYMAIKLGGTAAATKNGTLYARVATASGGKPIGGIEAAADSANTVAVPGAYFMGAADAQGNVEIAFNI